jgi:hypothetical protein
VCQSNQRQCREVDTAGKLILAGSSQPKMYIEIRMRTA